MSAAQKTLEALFEADRRARAAERKLLEGEPEDTLSTLLSEAVAEAKEVEDQEERSMRLYRLADICAQVPGPLMADALVDILDEEDPTLRVTAGEALLDVAYERYAEVAYAVERRLDANQNGPAMRELPYIVAEVGEPSALPLIARFLKLNDEEAVASGIESLANLQDPAALKFLRPLRSDTRTVWLDDQENSPSTIGQLAEEAISFLEQLQ